MTNTKTYTVRFSPNDGIEYEFVVEAESEDEVEDLGFTTKALLLAQNVWGTLVCL